MHRDLPTPAIAQALLDTIDPVISILASVGGSFVTALPAETADTALADFLRNVLRMDGSAIGSWRQGNLNDTSGQASRSVTGGERILSIGVTVFVSVHPGMI